jgi:hypothetical protein
VDGTVLSRQGDTLLLAVPSPLASQGSSTQRFYQRLDVPISQLIEVQRRELNRTKTYAVAAVAVVGAGALALWAFTSPSIFGNQSTPPVINNALLPAGLVPRPAWQLPLGRLRLGP